MLSLQSLGPSGPGDFFAYIEYPSQSVRYLLVYTLTNAFQTCTPLPATILPGFSISPDEIPFPLTYQKNRLIIKVFMMSV